MRTTAIAVDDPSAQTSSRKVKPSQPVDKEPTPVAKKSEPAVEEGDAKSESKKDSKKDSKGDSKSDGDKEMVLGSSDSDSDSAKDTDGDSKKSLSDLPSSKSEEKSSKNSVEPKLLGPVKGQALSKTSSRQGATEDTKSDTTSKPKNVLTPLSPKSSEEGLSLEEQQAKDEGECPGSEGTKVNRSDTSKDLPLEQEEHPFDAPAATPEGQGPAQREIVPKKIEEPNPITMTPQLKRLQQRINMCLAHYWTHPENLAKRSPWAVMHTILPYGVETEIVAGNRRVNAIGWMCYNGVCKTQRMFQPTERGFRTNVGPGVQGHEGQFLAILAQSGVPRDFPIVIGKTRYTVSDLIRYEMNTCREKSELTFKLIGLSHYLAPRHTWRDDQGGSWNLEKLVKEELEQPVVGAACGGTHRLMGLSYALMMRRRYDEPVVNQWARADIYLQDFVQYAFSLQNRDGSFSTEWFEGRAEKPDMERKVQTSGHILEWLVFTLPQEDLDDPRVVKAAEFLLSQVYDHRDHDWPIGPRGHALRALSLYDQRVFDAPTGQLKSYLSRSGYMKLR